jgi:diacylglycerol kinase family enzyme
MISYLFVNPLSGHYSASRFQAILAQLHGNGITPEVFRVHTPAEIISHCTSINERSECQLVIVAGGDGTINAVVNALKPATTTLAILPLGTSNVLATEIGISSIEDGLKKIAAGASLHFSVGVLELEGRSHRFLLMAGIGLDGAIVRDVWPLGKKFLKQGAYALSALKSAMAWDATLFKLSTPEGDVACHTAIICNASRYGGNFILSPGSSPFSSGLSAVCITGSRRRTYLSSALNLFRGRSGTNRDLVRMHSSIFEVRGRRPIQIDGDFVGYGPARISELADFARIIV